MSDDQDSRSGRNYSPSVGEAVEEATKSGRVATREGATSGTGGGEPLPAGKTPEPQAQTRGPTAHDMDAVESGTRTLDASTPHVIADSRSATSAGGAIGAGSATYARDVTVPADIDTEAAKSLRRDKETTDFRGARGAPGVGVPTGAAANTDKISRDKRKVVDQR